MSILDTLDNVHVDNSLLVDEVVRQKISGIATVAQKYLDTAKATEETFLALAEEQDDALIEAFGVAEEYEKFYRTTYSNEDLNPKNFRRNVAGQALNLMMRVINRHYSTDFSLSSLEEREIIDVFAENIEAKLFYDKVARYLNGVDFTQKASQETMQKFADTIRNRWNRGNKDETSYVEQKYFLTIKNKEVNFANFLYFDKYFYSSGISASTRQKLSEFVRYLNTILKDYSVNSTFPQWVETKARETTPLPTYHVAKDKQGLIASLRCFRNGNFKVAFTSIESRDAFLAPLEEYARSLGENE